jgi:peptidoglycan hydrolase-like protein with peptidoglycan-binding domain
MKLYQIATAMLALGGFAALPSCSMMGMHSPGSQTSSNAPMSQPAVAPDLVKQVQASLQKDGLYRGNVDGVWGPDTKAAVQHYQQSHNLTADGQLDSPTLSSLNLPQTATAAPTASGEPASSATGSPAMPTVSAPPAPANNTQ